MLQKIEVRDVGPIRKVAVALQPIHAFIGPNDSGKSTLLRCAQALSMKAHGGEPRFPSGAASGARIQGSTPHGVFSIDSLGPGNWRGSGLTPEVRAEIGLSVVVKFDAEALREPSPLIPESAQLTFVNERGQGLPGIYQAILSRGDDTFHRITAEVRELFPAIRNLRVPAISSSSLALEAELVDGRRVRAESLSDGILYYLGFIALLHITPVRSLLVEEPENGLHPARIRSVVSTLRRIAERHGTQVLIATHSPLVVNEMKPEEVSIVTRPSLDAGTQVTPIRETPNFERRASVYALGELWLSYADGTTEAPLLSSKADSP